MFSSPSLPRNEQKFRMLYLFQKCQISSGDRYCEHHPRMLQFLDDMENSALQLENKGMGRQISLEAIGGLLFIMGVALAPFTAGLSLGLILGGLSLGVTSGVNSAVSQFIRARAKLLRSELDAWQQMHESLLCGMLELERGQSILRQSLIDLLKDGKGLAKPDVSVPSQSSGALK